MSLFATSPAGVVPVVIRPVVVVVCPSTCRSKLTLGPCEWGILRKIQFASYGKIGWIYKAINLITRNMFRWFSSVLFVFLFGGWVGPSVDRPGYKFTLPEPHFR